jgi:hypothetical protein
MKTSGEMYSYRNSSGAFALLPLGFQFVNVNCWCRSVSRVKLIIWSKSRVNMKVKCLALLFYPVNASVLQIMRTVKKVINSWKLSGYLCNTRFNIQKFCTQPSGAFLFCSLTTHVYSIKWSDFGLVRKIAKSNCQFRHASPSVRMGQLRSHWTSFREFWYLSIFLRSVDQISLKSLTRITGTLHEDQCTFFWSHLAQFLFEWEMF